MPKFKTVAPQPATNGKPGISALASWFGNNRTLAKHVGRFVRGAQWLGVPFAGGMPELAEVDVPTVLVSDLHRHVINLGRVVKTQRAALQLTLRNIPAFHPDVLSAAQGRCLAREIAGCQFRADNVDAGDALAWARDYFVCCWMARSAVAGTDGEFNAGMSVRWDGGGGDSATRFRNAIDALGAWETVLARCTFVCLDVFDFLDNVKDDPKHCLYLDPPWPDDGGSYKHKFDEAKQRLLAARLGAFARCRIVVRYGDHPLVRELYPETTWRWHHYNGRRQSNRTKAEVLITRRAA